MDDMSGFLDKYDVIDIGDLSSFLVSDQDMSLTIISENINGSKSFFEFYAKSIKKIYFDLNGESVVDEYKELIESANPKEIANMDAVKIIKSWVRMFQPGREYFEYSERLDNDIERSFLMDEDDGFVSILFEGSNSRLLYFIL